MAVTYMEYKCEFVVLPQSCVVLFRHEDHWRAGRLPDIPWIVKDLMRASCVSAQVCIISHSARQSYCAGMSYFLGGGCALMFSHLTKFGLGYTHAAWVVSKFCRRVIVQRLRARLLALAMALHPRLGASSVLADLPSDLLGGLYYTRPTA